MWGRRIILGALASVMLSAQSPDKGTGGHDGNSQQNVAAAAQTAPFEQVGKGSEYEQECKQGSDNRRSDLCAQWKAADAAYAAAGSAWWMMWVAVVGTVIAGVTFVAVVLAARYAKEAADHTRTGADEARRAADAAEKSLHHAEGVTSTQLRPWIGVTATAKRLVREGEAVAFGYDVTFHNYGQTAAVNFQTAIKMVFAKEDEPYVDVLEQQWKEWKAPDSEPRATLLPGESDVFEMWGYHRHDWLPWGEEREGQRILAPLIVVSAFYKTPFDDQWHRTDRAYLFARRSTGARQAEAITDNTWNASAEQLVADPISKVFAT